MTSSTEQNQTSADAKQELETVPGDRYEVLGRLGVGAFGSVLKARDTFLNRLVAIKTRRSIPTREKRSTNASSEKRRWPRSSITRTS